MIPRHSGESRLDNETAHAMRQHLNIVVLSLSLLESPDAQVRGRAVATVRREADALSALINTLGATNAPTRSSHVDLPSPGTRVLVVEDEYLLAEAMTHHLQQACCEVIGPVGSVDDAIEAISQSSIDCALVDANLNGESSAPVVQALAIQGIGAAIVSGYDHAALAPDLRGLPFLQKPVNPQELLSTVAHLGKSGIEPST